MKAPYIPSIKGDLELIPLVLEAFSEVPSGDKKQIRKLLKNKFRERFISIKNGKEVTREGRILYSEIETKSHLEKTLMDGLALPTCERFHLISRGVKYALTTRGIKLLKAWEKNKDVKSNQEFLDIFGSILLQIDKEEWSGLIGTLLQIQYERGSGVSVEELIRYKNLKVPDYYITNILKFFKDVNIVFSDEMGKYKVNALRYEQLSGKKIFRGYEEVSNKEFFSVLYTLYSELTKNKRSPYVWIEDIRNEVCDRLNWPWEHFDKRMAEIPLIVGDKQILFSPSTFGRKTGIYRNGKYYNFISIYQR